jgi:OOP family OmpA-OmpF porin
MKKIFALLFGAFGLAACAGTDGYDVGQAEPTPTVDYIASVDPYGAEHKDMFLSQLTMNYRSYAVYNARVSGYPDIGELFAQKAVSAFSGETPMPESLDSWNITDQNARFELQNGCQDLMNALQNDATIDKPKLAAEAQAKFDCWLTAAASGQLETADECRTRFANAIAAINGNGGILEDDDRLEERVPEPAPDSGFGAADRYPNTAELGLLTDTKRTRDGIVIVNNINVPNDLIRPAPVHPVVFNQNIYGGARIGTGCAEDDGVCESDGEIGGEMVSRDEFINMMMALRNEIQEINRRLDSAPGGGIATVKVQQIPAPSEPRQRIVEEIFEVRFDFNKAEIMPEYRDVVRKLAETAKENKNVKISVVGHTDTVGSDAYNYALGGRRAENVKKMLVDQGIPATSIIAVSSGKNDLKVSTGKNVKNAENRRVRVVKEVRYMEQPKQEKLPDPIVEVLTESTKTATLSPGMPDPVKETDGDFVGEETGGGTDGTSAE